MVENEYTHDIYNVMTIRAKGEGFLTYQTPGPHFFLLTKRLATLGASRLATLGASRLATLVFFVTITRGTFAGKRKKYRFFSRNLWWSSGIRVLDEGVSQII